MVLAQIIPDNTLGSETSEVIPNIIINGELADQIDGGAIRGGNLFHSFEQFNVADGQRVFFDSPIGIENILSRVTGLESSEILGTLGVNGNANLFLLNPNGIIFGPNAQLDVNGSFVASTASSLQFENQGFFSVTVPNEPALLTVNPSAFFFNQVQTGQIENRSAELQVPNGESLLLVGGALTLMGGSLEALNGQVELAAVGNSAVVELTTSESFLSVSVSNTNPLGNILITNGAVIGSSGEGSQGIQVLAQQVTFSEAEAISFFSTEIVGSGSVAINTIEPPQVIGSNIPGTTPSSLLTAALSRQDEASIGADIDIVAEQMEAKIPQISQRCQPGTGISSFVTTGRGGIPLGPSDAIINQDLWEDLYLPEHQDEVKTVRSSSFITRINPLVEAQGWVLTPEGQVLLTEFSSMSISYSFQRVHSTCSQLGSA
ncbi:MAG: filamentous hemagglutinin N-terminal domain-containing protein [Cyanothece sp. SIO1E1]|nr:filamentous hemagglutinin N-terminal domain-containing protein [Cyanothece sp. SIO1E1]